MILQQYCSHQVACSTSWHSIRNLCIGCYHRLSSPRVCEESRVTRKESSVIWAHCAGAGQEGCVSEGAQWAADGVRTFLNLILLSPSSCGSEEAGYPGFCSSSFISSFDMIELMFASLAPLFYPNTFQAQKRLISILFQNKGSVKVLALESILAFAKVCKKKTYPKVQHFY